MATYSGSRVRRAAQRRDLFGSCDEGDRGDPAAARWRRRGWPVQVDPARAHRRAADAGSSQVAADHGGPGRTSAATNGQRQGQQDETARSIRSRDDEYGAARSARRPRRRPGRRRWRRRYRDEWGDDQEQPAAGPPPPR